MEKTKLLGKFGIILALMLALLPAAAYATETQLIKTSNDTSTTLSTELSFNISGVYDYDEANEVVKQLNSLRNNLGLSALTMDKTLTSEAMQRAAEIAFYYSHTRPDGTSCSTVVSSSFSYFGENIAMVYFDASDVMDGWTK